MILKWIFRVCRLLKEWNVDIIIFLLTLGYMFRFSRNHQALSKKYKDPLHKTMKTRSGTPNVPNKHLVMIHMSLLTVIPSGYLSLDYLKL
jgi:hypothetical protein